MIYLNNSATSYPKPECVLNAINNCLKLPIASEGRGSEYDETRDILNSCRKTIANFFNFSDYKRVILLSNATEALNLSLRGLLNSGDHIVVSEIEHTSVLRPIHHLKDEKGIDFTIIPVDKNGVIEPEEIKKAIKNKTKAVVVTHASNVLGTIQDIYSISKIVKEKEKIFIVDATQSAGVINIDLTKCKIDLLCITGHKYLLGPTGIGCLIIGNDKIKLNPIIQGGTGSKSDYLYQPEELPDYYEAGTRNFIGAAGLDASLKWIVKKGINNIFLHKQMLLKVFFENIDSKKYTIYNNPSLIHNNIGVILLNHKVLNSLELSNLLYTNYKIVTRPGLHCAPLVHKRLGTYNRRGALRISPGVFNTKEEIKNLTNILNKL